MNAQELYAIVSKVPKRWPKNVDWLGGEFVNLYYHGIDDDHAEMLFEASLARAGAFGVAELVDGTFRAFDELVDGTDINWCSPPYPSRVAALAHAVMAMGGA